MPSSDISGRPAGGPSSPARETTRKNRRFFLGILIACVAVIAFAVGVGVFKYVYDTRDEVPSPRVDLSSIFPTGTWKGIPEVQNPAVVLQEHLEHLRLRQFGAAYDDQSRNLKALTTRAEFTANARKNEPLFREIAAYHFPAYAVNGETATLSGTIDYENGGTSKVDAALVKEGGRWKMAGITLVYQ